MGVVTFFLQTRNRNFDKFDSCWNQYISIHLHSYYPTELTFVRYSIE